MRVLPVRKSKIDIKINQVISFKPIQGDSAMSSITIRNLPEETHRALRLRATLAGRSTEAEVRAILEQAARPARAHPTGIAAGRNWPTSWWL
jgi:hypothetical protein